MSFLSTYNADIEFRLRDKRKLESWLQDAIKGYKKHADSLNIIFCSDEYLHRMNVDFLQHDDYTDIITFDYCEGKLLKGELYISLERVKENAKSFGVSFKNELHRVIIHGVLHLLGHKDKSAADQKKMRAEEDRLLNLRAF